MRVPGSAGFGVQGASRIAHALTDVVVTSEVVVRKSVANNSACGYACCVLFGIGLVWYWCSLGCRQGFKKPEAKVKRELPVQQRAAGGRRSSRQWLSWLLMSVDVSGAPVLATEKPPTVHLNSILAV